MSCEIACVVASRSERSREPVEQRGRDLGVLRDLGGEAAVEHGERGGGEHAPLRVDGQQLALGRRLPRADQVAGAEQLGAHVVGDDQLAGDHALEHEQADVVGARARQPRHVPRADAQAVGAHEQPALGVGAARLGEQPAEIGVGLEQRDLFRPHAFARVRGDAYGWCGNWSSPGCGAAGSGTGGSSVRAAWRPATVPCRTAVSAAPMSEAGRLGSAWLTRPGAK